MSAAKICLADHGKHRWKYRTDSMLGRVRTCQKCGVVQQRRDGRYVQIVEGERPSEKVMRLIAERREQSS